MALAKPYKLKHRSDFNRVHHQGRRLRSSHFTMLFLLDLPDEKSGESLNSSPDSTASEPCLSHFGKGKARLLPPEISVRSSEIIAPKIGISVSQKVSKRAVQRNRLKRQIRAIMRQFLPGLPPGLKLIIRVRPGAVGCEYQEFLRELKALLNDAGVLNGYS